jgi:putative peptidoglycan lipid II flippase
MGMLTVLVLSLIAKFSGAFKEVVLADAFGTSALMDQFIFAFAMASLLASLLSSILVMSLTPVLSQIDVSKQNERSQFLAQLWGGCIALNLLVAIALWLLFPFLSPAAREAGPRLAAMVGVVSFFLGLSALATAVLVSLGKQLGSLLEGLPSLILGITVLSDYWAPANALVFGLIVGVALQLFSLMLAQWRYVGAVRVAVPVAGQHWRRLFSGLGFTAAGYTLLMLTMAVEINIASHFPTGNAASLGYATRVTALVIGLLLPAVNRVAVVHFCEARHANTTPWQSCATVLWPLVVCGLAVSALMVVFAPEIVTMLYQRGEFDEAATASVSQLMRWHVCQLAPSLAATGLCAYLSATGGYRAIFFACALAFLSEVVFALAGAQLWGMQAVAAAPMVGRLVMLAYLLKVVLSKTATSPTRPIASAFQP